MRLSHRLASLTLVLLLSAAFARADSRWTEDHAAARQQAEQLDRPILVLFTGSDWCGYCIKLENEVFSDQAFYDWANQHVVLLKADFPRRRPMSDALKAANLALRDRAPNFQGYPSLYLWNPKSDTLKAVMVGYDGSGTNGVIREISGSL